MPETSLEMIVAILSLLVAYRMARVQSGSAALLQTMEIRRSQLLDEVTYYLDEGADAKSPKPTDIIEVLSYLNLVCKLYLNGAINVNMLRTFEHVIIKAMSDRRVIEQYREISIGFEGYSEPPYINLVYARSMLIKFNDLHKDAWLPTYREKIAEALMRTKFHWWAGKSFLWDLQQEVIEACPKSAKTEEKPEVQGETVGATNNEA